MFGERLHRARKAADISLRELGDLLGVSHTTINKYEKGDLMPSSGQLLQLARALGVRSEYFFRPVEVDLADVEYRKRANTPKKLLARIDANIRNQAELWRELLALFPARPVVAFSLPDGLPDHITGPEDIEHIAAHVRGEWALGLNPIPDMIDTLESQGIMVIVTDVADEGKFDGLAGSIANVPVIVVSAGWPGDRQRFTLAHELGHLLLKERLPKGMDEEKACNQFAGAFLLPRAAVQQHLGELRHAIEPAELLLFKHEFGISMMGALYRAYQCGVITEYLRDKYFRDFSRRGWRTREPGEPYPAERTFLFKQLVYRAYAEDYIGESKAAELLEQPLHQFHRERQIGNSDAVADQ